jgi:hypothetical protein
MIASTDLKTLRLAFRELLVPILAENGYSSMGRESVDIDDRAIGEKAYLYHFSKVASDGRRFAVTINIKSFTRPTFVIIAGEVPPEGVPILCPAEIVPAEKATADMLVTQSNLQSAANTKSYSPFRPRLLQGIGGYGKSIRGVVEKAAKHLPELLAFIERGTPSNFVRTLSFPRPASLVSGSP